MSTDTFNESIQKPRDAGAVDTPLRVGVLGTRWQTSLPNTKTAAVSIVYGNSAVYCGSNGRVFKLMPEIGRIAATNSLRGRGDHEVRLTLADGGDVILVGTAGYAMALSVDDLTTIWQTSLPKTRSNVVSIVTDGTYVYCGSNGQVLKLDATGACITSADLEELGHHEVRLALSAESGTLCVGIGGYLLGMSTDLATLWQTSLPNTKSEVVSVIAHGTDAIAGSNGYVFRVNSDGQILAQNSLPGRSHEEMRLAVSTLGEMVIVGTNGFALGLAADTLNTKWQTSLPHTGDEIVSLVVGGSDVFAGSNGYVYQLAVATGELLAESALAGLGHHAVEIAINEDADELFIGTGGYAVGASMSWDGDIARDRWMGALEPTIGARRLREIVLPGTHDSGTYGIRWTSGFANDDCSWLMDLLYLLWGAAPPVIVARWARTQGQRVSHQLADGVRYFDLRVEPTAGVPTIVHCMWSVAVKEILQDVADFLQQSSHAGEVVILDFNHFYQMGASEHAALVALIKQMLGTWMAPAAMGTDVTLDALTARKKNVIVVYQNADVKDPLLWPSSVIKSDWANTTSLPKLHDALAEVLETPHSNFFVLQGVLTEDRNVIAAGLNPLSSAPSSLEEWAPETNRHVTAWLRDEWYDRRPNIVILDWIEKSDLVDLVIALNRYVVPGAGAPKTDAVARLKADLERGAFTVEDVYARIQPAD